MPGVPSVWATSPASNAPVGAGRLNYDLYTYDSNQFHATGVNFHTFRPLFYEVLVNYGTGTVAGFSSGTYTQTVLSGGGNSGTTTPTSLSVYDTSGMWGPGGEYTQGAYEYAVNVPGSDGNGNPGGYYLMGHFVELSGETSTSDFLGADMFILNTTSGTSQVATGARQPFNSARNNCTFFLDLVPTGPNAPSPNGTNAGEPYIPAVGITDSGTTSTNKYTCSSASSSQPATFGEMSRHFNAWVAINGSNSASWGNQNSPGTPQLLWPAGTQLTSTLMSNAVEMPLQFLGNPPCFRAATMVGGNVTTATTTVVPFTTGASTTIYNGFTYWNTSTFTYTIQVAGIYLFHGVVSYASGTLNAFAAAGASINGTAYWGPSYYQGGVPGNTCCTKTQIFSLQAGDTVQLITRQNTGSTIGLATGVASRFLLTWLGGNGKTLGGTIGQPNTTLTVPDTSFRFQAGTPGNVLQPQVQQHLGNDINWFFNVPYFMGYQSATSSLGTTGNWSGAIPLQSRTGQVHADNGDPWSGWNATSNWWVPPVTGWYLIVSEQTVATTNMATTSSLVAGISVTSSGGKTPASAGATQAEDWYQHIWVSTASPGTGQPPLGATAIGLYYLQAGTTDNVWITAMAQAQTAAASTSITNGVTHMEAVWMGA